MMMNVKKKSKNLLLVLVCLEKGDNQKKDRFLKVRKNCWTKASSGIRVNWE